jgi:acyl-CoA reductase-like NAD-dependent aldehyde dehydrogenase
MRGGTPGNMAACSTPTGLSRTGLLLRVGLKSAAGYFREVVVAFKSIIPHNPSDVLGEFEEAGAYDVEIAVVGAREAFFEWREQLASVRSGALANIGDDVEKWAEELVRLTVTEVGKLIGGARAEVEQAAAILRYYAQMVLAPAGEICPASRYKDWLMTRRYPLGVCALSRPGTSRWQSPPGKSRRHWDTATPSC